jgi:hypothetical protein
VRFFIRPELRFFEFCLFLRLFFSV